MESRSLPAIRKPKAVGKATKKNKMPKKIAHTRQSGLTIEIIEAGGAKNHSSNKSNKTRKVTICVAQEQQKRPYCGSCSGLAAAIWAKPPDAESAAACRLLSRLKRVTMPGIWGKGISTS